MRRPIFYLLIAVALIMPQQSFAQYQSRLYDVDRTSDDAINIRRKADGNLLISGGSATDSAQQLGTIILSNNGSQLLSKKVIGYPGKNIFQNGYGRFITLQNGNYAFNPTFAYPSNKPLRQTAAALMVINGLGDTIRTTIYTDTSIHAEVAYGISQGLDKTIISQVPA